MPPKRKVTSTVASTYSKRAKKSKLETINTNDNDVTDQSKGTNEMSNEKKSLKIVSWNVNGIRAALKNKAFDYFKNEECDVLCLQETKCNQSNFPQELSSWNQFPYKYYATSKQDGYAGVTLFSKQKPLSIQYGLNNPIHDAEGRMITAFYEQFILVNAYTPNAGRGLKRLDYRMKWDEDFRNYLQQLDSQKPVILCGDLNVAHREIDIENPKSNVKNAGFTPEERANFTALLEAGFNDSYRLLYPNRTRMYTFWSYMRNARAKNVGWRLDYFVTSNRLYDAIVDNEIRSEVMGSDHCPIVLTLNLL